MVEQNIFWKEEFKPKRPCCNLKGDNLCSDCPFKSLITVENPKSWRKKKMNNYIYGYVYCTFCGIWVKLSNTHKDKINSICHNDCNKKVRMKTRKCIAEKDIRRKNKNGKRMYKSNTR